MGADDEEAGGGRLDEKAKRMRDLLSSFYSPDNSSTNNSSSSGSASLDAINSPSFDAYLYMSFLVIALFLSPLVLLDVSRNGGIPFFARTDLRRHVVLSI